MVETISRLSSHTDMPGTHPLRVHILRHLQPPPIPPLRLDLLHTKPIQHAQIQRRRIDMLRPMLLVRFRQRSHLGLAHVWPDLRPHVHAAGLAEQLAPDAVAEGVVGDVIAAGEGQLRGGGVDPDGALGWLAQVSDLWDKD